MKYGFLCCCFLVRKVWGKINGFWCSVVEFDFCVKWLDICVCIDRGSVSNGCWFDFFVFFGVMFVIDWVFFILNENLGIVIK